MTFLEIITLTQNRMSDSTSDEESMAVIKSAINQSYMTDIATLNPVLASAIIPAINGLVTLPSDCINLISISPELIEGERRIGSYIITSRNSIFTIIYSSVPAPLVEDTDIIGLSERYAYMMSTYGVYAYYAYRKKTEAANIFLSEYNDLIGKMKYEPSEDSADSEVVGDYYSKEVLT